MTEGQKMTGYNQFREDFTLFVFYARHSYFRYIVYLLDSSPALDPFHLPFDDIPR